MRLVAPAVLCSLAAGAGFTLVESRDIELPSQKRFQLLMFGRDKRHDS
ncbi:MAG: hypothetical protein ACRET0_07285 [Steroidobacteraceae bacterium]